MPGFKKRMERFLNYHEDLKPTAHPRLVARHVVDAVGNRLRVTGVGKPRVDLRSHGDHHSVR